jgi:transposase InsO family protein
VADLTYIKLREEFIYLAIIMDVHTRVIRGWSVGRSLGVELTLGALEQALLKGRPEIHHLDQGLQYAAADYVSCLSQVGSQISRARRTKRLCRASDPNYQRRRSCAGATIETWKMRGTRSAVSLMMSI